MSIVSRWEKSNKTKFEALEDGVEVVSKEAITIVSLMYISATSMQEIINLVMLLLPVYEVEVVQDDTYFVEP